MSLVSYARRTAGLSQRELADRSGVPQPAIARIESRRTVPRIDTIQRLLRACGVELELSPLAGGQIDRSVIRRLRRLSPAERAALAVAEARNLEKVLARRRR